MATTEAAPPRPLTEVADHDRAARTEARADAPDIRLAILQRVCPSYRVALFRSLTNGAGVTAKLFIGEDVPNSKVRSGRDLSDIGHEVLPTRFLRLGRRVLPWHRGLVDRLRSYDPDVILCEGESHFLGYLQAIYYRFRFKRSVALMHWCFISLPGWSHVGGRGHRAWIKRFFRRVFDAFVLYSSYSRDRLMELGEPQEKMFVATNVCDTEGFIARSDALEATPSEARRRLGLPDRFTVLYLGTLDANKRPDVMLRLAARMPDISFALVGDGELLAHLRDVATNEGLQGVFLPGRVTDELALWYRASDVLLVPGRGGIVVSEAMAFGVPCIVHQGDGTEYDLIRPQETGILTDGGELADYEQAVTYLWQHPDECRAMGARAQRLIRDDLTTDNMVAQITAAARFASESRLSRPL